MSTASLTAKEIRELEKNIVEISPNKYMIATVAHHLIGSLSRDTEGVDEDNLCEIWGETGDYYVGGWVTGLGFFSVMFPKSTTRELTPDEVKKFNRMKFAIGSQPSFKLNIKEAKPPAFRVELVWNREFDFVPYGEQHADLDSAIKKARELEDMGDGERVKKARVIDSEGNIVYACGRKITPIKKDKNDPSA